MEEFRSKQNRKEEDAVQMVIDNLHGPIKEAIELKKVLRFDVVELTIRRNPDGTNLNLRILLAGLAQIELSLAGRMKQLASLAGIESEPTNKKGAGPPFLFGVLGFAQRSSPPSVPFWNGKKEIEEI